MTLTFFFFLQQPQQFQRGSSVHFFHSLCLSYLLSFLAWNTAETWVRVTSRGEFNGKYSSNNGGRESDSLAIHLCYNQTPTFRFAMFADHSGEKKEESRGFVMLRVADEKRHIATQHTVNILLRRGCFVDRSHCRQAQIKPLCVHYSRWRAAPQVFLGGLVPALDTSQQRNVNVRVYKSSKRLGWKQTRCRNFTGVSQFACAYNVTTLSH